MWCGNICAPLELNDELEIDKLNGYTTGFLEPSKRPPIYYEQMLLKYSLYFDNLFAHGKNISVANLTTTIKNHSCTAQQQQQEEEEEDAGGDRNEDDKDEFEDSCLRTGILKV